jgi:ABC-type Fe3+/spermidine/putrescine transport system ATPase subunit
LDEEPILKVEALTKDYGSAKAVDSVSFSIDSGKIVGLLGPNGAGKTTTINMILGILEPTQDVIEIFRKNLKEHRSKISKSINFAAVYAHMPANLTVWQNLFILGLLYEVRNLKERIEFCYPGSVQFCQISGDAFYYPMTNIEEMLFLLRPSRPQNQRTGYHCFRLYYLP